MEFLEIIQESLVKSEEIPTGEVPEEASPEESIKASF